MSAYTPHAEYIEEGDILYVSVRDAEVHRTRNLGHWRNLDLASDGSVVAVEFINVTAFGVDLSDIPERETVEQWIEEAGFHFPPPDVRAAKHASG